MSYTIQMRAFEQSGSNGNYEDYKAQTAMTTESTPSSPLSVSTTSKSTTNLTIEWQIPVQHSLCVHHYRICYKINDDSIDISTPELCDETSNTTYIMSDLEPCATYRIRVSAVTPLGVHSLDTIHHDTTEYDRKLENF